MLTFFSLYIEVKTKIILKINQKNMIAVDEKLT